MGAGLGFDSRQNPEKDREPGKNLKLPGGNSPFPDENQSPNLSPPVRWAVWVGWSLLIGIAFFLAYRSFGDVASPVSLSSSEFFARVDEGSVAEITINTSTFEGEGKLADGKEFTANVGAITDELMERLEKGNVDFDYDAPSDTSFPSLFFLIIPIVLIVGVMVWMGRRTGKQTGAMAQFTQSHAKLVTKSEQPTVTFSDVAGHEGPKAEIAEVVEFLKDPDRFRAVGASMPKGLLLVGPPGTGKTLLARAVAGEADVPFFAVTGSDFVEMFVGVGAARVRDLFENAKKQAPSLVFIDELDSIGRKRGAGLGGGHDEREQTLNQLLAEMDGFEGNEGVVMLSATNRPDVLDPALLRSGRFDRQIVVPLPMCAERIEILRVHVRKKKVAPDVDFEVIARGTPGFSGADLANLANEAALRAVRAHRGEISVEDFDQARDRVLMGIERHSLAMSEEERRITACHEAGHAVCGILVEEADDIHKVTILPIGAALGVTQFLPEERWIESEQRFLARLIVALGGRAAEETVSGKRSAGAQNDLREATQLARKMVRQWGMSDLIGPVSYAGDSSTVFLGEDLARSQEYSEATARRIDDEVLRLVRHAHEEASAILCSHRRELDLLADTLLARETLTGDEVRALVCGDRLEENPSVDAATDADVDADVDAGTDAGTDADVDAEETVGKRRDARA